MNSTKVAKDVVIGLGMGLIVLGAMMLAFFTIDLYGATHPVHKPLPACLEEDGSTQQECLWDDGTGLIVHNWDYGKHYETWART